MLHGHALGATCTTALPTHTGKHQERVMPGGIDAAQVCNFKTEYSKQLPKAGTCAPASQVW